MKRLLIFLAALSACGLYAFYGNAVHSSEGADTVMRRIALGLGIPGFFALWLVRKHALLSAGAILYLVFWFAIHPWAVLMSPEAWSIALIPPAIFVASLMHDQYEKTWWTYVRLLLAAWFGLIGAILGQFIAYTSHPGDPLWIGLVVEGAFFLSAFAAAPWRVSDFEHLGFAALRTEK